MKNLLMTNGVYGAKIGHRTVFTREGAIERYNLFLKVCYSDVTIESAKVLSDVEHDMVEIGFTYEELEQLENKYFESINEVAI